MKKLENKVMLVTYADSMGGDLKALNNILETRFQGVIKGLHILPCYPSSGDRGFAVIRYDEIDARFGDWEDICALSNKYTLMLDFMVNHVSVRSAEFVDYMQNGDQSANKRMFIDWDSFWEGDGPTDADMALLYKRKEKGPYKTFTRQDGKTVRLWNTFFDEQVDIDPFDNATQAYYEKNLTFLSRYAAIIRFDALAYTTKRPGTNCFFVEPEIWEVLDATTGPLKRAGTQMIAEIHGDYRIQRRIAERGWWVYDFALPMLLLHGLMTGRTDRLIHWIRICPRNQFTTLDTHDGIGIADAEGLLDPDEIDLVRTHVNACTAYYQQYNRVVVSSVSVNGEKPQQYQLMTSYYEALDCDDQRYLLARIVQLFVPGIPQIYYVGLLAGINDVEELKKTGDLRSVNRHNYTVSEIDECMQKPMLQRLYQILVFRNQYPAFNGRIEADDEGKTGRLRIRWSKDAYEVTLRADFSSLKYEIVYLDGNTTDVL